jgi:hypothetical protein
MMTSREFQVYLRLMRMVVGATTVIRDRVVTRWGRDAYEVNTMRRGTYRALDVAFAIAHDAD